MKNKRRRWTEEENDFLKQNHLQMTDKEIAEILGRTTKAITIRRSDLGLVYDYKEWTDEEVQFIKQNYLEMTDSQLATALNRVIPSVNSKRKHMGLTRTAIYAVYKGDKFIMTGTKKEIADKLGVLEETVTFYMSRAYQLRCTGGNCKRVIKIGYE